MYNVMKTPVMISAYLVLVVLTYHLLDKPIALYFYQFNLRVNAPFLNLITDLGQYKLAIPILFLLGMYFRFIRSNPIYEGRSWYLFLCVIIPVLINLILKISFGRARPELLFLNGSYGFYWFQFKKLYVSFPSGHTTTVTALASGLSIVFPRYFFVFFSVAILIILSRIFLYYHYLSDVMVAFYLSALVVGFFTEYLRKKRSTGIAGVKVPS